MSDVKFDEKFVDPATGETVTRIKVPPNLLTEIEKNAGTSMMHANNFMQLCRNAVLIARRIVEEHDKATAAEQNLGKEVIRVREKMNVDTSWLYVIPLKMLEKREPPPDTKTVDAT